MTAPCSVDLRARALARKVAGATHRAIAVALRIVSGPITLRGLTVELAERGIKTQPSAVLMFLPPANPEMNPIGQGFSK